MLRVSYQSRSESPDPKAGLAECFILARPAFPNFPQGSRGPTTSSCSCPPLPPRLLLLLSPASSLHHHLPLIPLLPCCCRNVSPAHSHTQQDVYRSMNQQDQSSLFVDCAPSLGRQDKHICSPTSMQSSSCRPLGP